MLKFVFCIELLVSKCFLNILLWEIQLSQYFSLKTCIHALCRAFRLKIKNRIFNPFYHKIKYLYYIHSSVIPFLMAYASIQQQKSLDNTKPYNQSALICKENMQKYRWSRTTWAYQTLDNSIGFLEYVYMTSTYLW